MPDNTTVLRVSRGAMRVGVLLAVGANLFFLLGLGAGYLLFTRPGPARAATSGREIKVALASSPAGAAVSLDGETVGQTPLELRLPPGEGPFDVRVTRRGFRPEELRLSPERDTAIALKLIREEEPEIAGEPPVEPPGAADPAEVEDEQLADPFARPKAKEAPRPTAAAPERPTPEAAPRAENGRPVDPYARAKAIGDKTMNPFSSPKPPRISDGTMPFPVK
jgi:hypothetical protein